MKAHGPKTQPPLRSGDKNDPLRIEVDFERYAPLLESADLTNNQKREFLQAIWSIIIGFVDLGFEITPASDACGQFRQNTGTSPSSAPDTLHSKHRTLIEQFVAADREREAAE